LIIFLLFQAADRSISSSIQEAREAMTNVACDVLRSCLSNNHSNRAFSLLVPYSLRLVPLYMLSLIKSVWKKTPRNHFLISSSFRPLSELVVHRNSMIEDIILTYARLCRFNISCKYSIRIYIQFIQLKKK